MKYTILYKQQALQWRYIEACQSTTMQICYYLIYINGVHRDLAWVLSWYSLPCRGAKSVQLVWRPYTRTQGQSFDFVHVTPNDVKSCIVNMDSKRSTGYDGIPIKLLKVGTDPLSMIISELINMSIDEWAFPDLLKYAEIAALFKKLDRLCKQNYRPVSILTALSKVFEKIYCPQLTSYFDCLFSKYLSGFRQKYSCQSTLLRMLEEWKSALDNGNMVGSIAINLSRAFDSLPHGLLLAKIYAYGVNIVQTNCELPPQPPPQS